MHESYPHISSNLGQWQNLPHLEAWAAAGDAQLIAAGRAAAAAESARLAQEAAAQREEAEQHDLLRRVIEARAFYLGPEVGESVPPVNFSAGEVATMALRAQRTGFC